MAELDEQWSKTKQSALDIKITFPAQCTRREAMQLLHWSMMLGLKRIDLEAAQARNAVLRPSVSKTALANGISQIIENAAKKTKLKKWT